MLLILGLLLLAAAAAFTVGVVIDNEQEITLDVFDRTETVSVAGVYLVGALSALVLAIGLSLAISGWSRLHRRRRERKAALDREAAERAELAERNEALQRQLDQTRHAVDRQTERDTKATPRAGFPAYPAEPGTTSAEGAPRRGEVPSGRHRSDS